MPKGKGNKGKGKAPPKKRVCRDTSTSTSTSTSTDGDDHHLELSKPQEEDMVMWLRHNPILWKVDVAEYLRRSTKNTIWENKAAELKVDVFDLMKWFQGRRLLFRHLSQMRAVTLSANKKWIVDNYSFLNFQHYSRTESPVKVEPRAESSHDSHHPVYYRRTSSDSSQSSEY